jgi:hypothetical protein
VVKIPPMTTPDFLHLRFHSEFSINDGIVRIDDVVKCAKNDDMPALGISDLSNLFGMVKFYKACRNAGLKPIVGCDVWLENEQDRDKPFRVLLICKNRSGYGRLSELLTDAYRTNQYRGRSEIRKSWLEQGDNSGLICLSGAHQGDVGQALLAGNDEAAMAFARWWSARFPDFRVRHHHPDGLPRLLPDRGRLHQLGQDTTACRWGRAGARAPARWWPTRSASPTSIRWLTRCCSSASSTRNGCRCPTSTSTSARTTAGA